MTVHDTLQRRLATTPGRGDEDSGFALIFVLLITMIVMAGTATMLTVTSNNIGPAKRTQDSLAALAAAQSGVQDFAATLNARCYSFSIQTCAWLTANPTVTNPALGAGSTETWSVTPQNAGGYTGNDGTVRVTSRGTSNGVSKTLRADISGKPSVLQYTYFSNYETVGTSFLDSYFGPRTITITDPDVAAAIGKPVGTTVTWTGTATAPANAYTDDVCNALYYGSSTNPTGYVTGGRAAAKAARSNLPSGTDFSEDGYTRTPTQQLLALVAPGAKTGVTRSAPCEVTFSKGMKFTGPVYSRDALYVSNGEWGSVTGPSFTVPSSESLPAASTAWSTTSSPSVANPTTPYRSMPLLGGTPTTASTGTTQIVQTSPFTLSLPTSAAPDATCVYTGPTRIVLSGATATVTSPQTAAAGGSCYAFDSSKTVSVPITSGTTISVKDGSAATTTAPTFPGLALGAGGDVTSYSPYKGDVYLQGSLTSGRLSVVSSDDIIATGDITSATATATDANGERSWQSGSAIDLVATNNVRVYHPVACASGTATNGYCPNDISGLYTNAQAGTVVTDTGTLRSTHPSLQYCPIVSGSRACATADNTNTSDATPDRRIDAAVFALNGSLLTDNYNRGRALGVLLVNGGVYESHRGATGQVWEIPTATSTRHNSGYKLDINYLSLRGAGLPYVPVLLNSGSPTSRWQVVSMSNGASS